jgi:hypothetical protein
MQDESKEDDVYRQIWRCWRGKKHNTAVCVLTQMARRMLRSVFISLLIVGESLSMLHVQIKMEDI